MSAATRHALVTAGTARLAAALARHGIDAAPLPGLRPLTAGQEPMAGPAAESLEDAPPGAVLVLRGAAAVPPVPLLLRRAVAGLLSERPLRAAAEIARAGVPAWQGSGQALAVVPAGTFLLGDRGGVIALPATLAESVAAEALEAIAYEEFVAEQVSSGGGVYGLHIPSGDQARHAFEQWRRLKGK